MGIAWQNVAYNMPPHLGYYLPDRIKMFQLAEIPYLFTGVSTGESDLVHPTWGTNVTVAENALSMLATAATNYDNRFACTSTENVWRYRDVDDTYAGLWCQNGGPNSRYPNDMKNPPKTIQTKFPKNDIL